MGTRIIEPSIGVNCNNWNPPAETPDHVYVMFWDIKKGNQLGAVQAPNLHLFKLPQRVGSPCVWEFWDAAFGWWVQVGMSAIDSWVYLGDDNLFPNYYFRDITGPVPFPEFHIYDNIYVGPIGTWGYNGHATIFWMTAASGLVSILGFTVIDDLLLEVFPGPGTDFVLKFCSISHRINVKIRLTP